VLVTGASGVVGTATVEEFLARGWDVVAVSRRPPEIPSHPRLRHVPMDLRNRAECAQQVSRLRGVTHVVYAAVHELPGLVTGWRDPEQMRTNLQMLTNVIDPLQEVADLRHVTLLQGTKAYGVHLHPIRIPAREQHRRDDHPNFYWLHEDYLRKLAAERGWQWTILRPQLVVGPNVGVAMNLPPVIGAYAALRYAEGKPFSFPGGAPYVCEAVDTRLVARAAAWAAVTPVAWGEHFNLTNGEVFSWRDLWPAMAEALGVEIGPDEPIRLAEYLPQRAALWEELVRRHGLGSLTLMQLLGQSHHYADFHFAYGATEAPPPAFLSTVKIKQAGFCDTWNTEDSFVHWLRVLQSRRVLPCFR
jgi:nucleoside-diphosphate-sugar epimerase